MKTTFLAEFLKQVVCQVERMSGGGGYGGEEGRGGGSACASLGVTNAFAMACSAIAS